MQANHATIAEQRKDYEGNGYAVLKGAASPEIANGLLGMITRQLAQPDVAKQFLAQPRVNDFTSYEFHGRRSPAMFGFHWGLTSIVRELSGKRLAPTYCFFRAYQKGDVCLVHADRHACEHSMSLSLGYSDDLVWNFEVGRRHISAVEAEQLAKQRDFGAEPFDSVLLSPGDAIVYKGVNRRHGRMTPNPNRWSAHLFLHWVDLDGEYKDWAFERNAPPAPRDFEFPR